MNPSILTALKNRSKLSKKYYVNPSMINKEELNSYSKYCYQIIIGTKDKFLNRVSVKLDDTNTSVYLQRYIVNHFFNNKKFLLYHLFCLMVLQFQILSKQLIFLTHSFPFNIHRLIHLSSYVCLLIRRKTAQTLLTYLSHY